MSNASESLQARQGRDRRERRIALSNRFRDGRFQNTNPSATAGLKNPTTVMGDFLRSDGRRPTAPLPLFAHTRAILQTPPSTLRMTWLGHSTVIIEIDGVRLLTDPVWGERASPFSFMGPKRFHAPPLSLAELPPIDAVLLTHDHYDHLCASTVRALAAGKAPGFSGRFITTLGVGAHLEKLGVQPHHIEELDWSDGAKVGDVDVVAVPAQHFSGRGALDRNTTLWAGFAILGPKHRVFTSGDTGPTPEHKDIGASLGPFDVVMFEIGAYHPAWGDIHLGPNAAYEQFIHPVERARVPARALGHVRSRAASVARARRDAARTRFRRWRDAVDTAARRAHRRRRLDVTTDVAVVAQPHLREVTAHRRLKVASKRASSATTIVPCELL